MCSMSCTPPSVDITVADFAQSKTAMYHDDDGELTCVYHVVETQHNHRLNSSRSFSHADKQNLHTEKDTGKGVFIVSIFLHEVLTNTLGMWRTIIEVLACAVHITMRKTRHEFGLYSQNHNIYTEKKRTAHRQGHSHTCVHRVKICLLTNFWYRQHINKLWPARHLSRYVKQYVY